MIDTGENHRLAPDSTAGARPRSGLAGAAGLAGVLLLGALALLQPRPGSPPPAAGVRGKSSTTTSAFPDAAQGRPCTMSPAGYLKGRFFGALDLDADWSGPDLLCDGMRRARGDGVRLLFAREYAGGQRLLIVIGIEAQGDALAGKERPANVTVIDERDGRFFSTGGSDRCWVDVRSVEAAGRHPDRRIDGTLYCAGALPSLQDRASLTLGDFRFSGRFADAD